MGRKPKYQDEDKVKDDIMSFLDYEGGAGFSAYDISKQYIKEVMKQETKTMPRNSFNNTYRRICYLLRILFAENAIIMKKQVESGGRIPKTLYWKKFKPKISDEKREENII